MPPLSSEKLIGFDARVMWLGVEDLWDEHRRGMFLVRQDVQRILSTDEMVWPSVFADSTIGIGTKRIEINGPNISDKWIGVNNPHWESLEELRGFLKQHPAGTKRPAWVIAVSCIADPKIMSETTGVYLDKSNPPAIDDEWKFLGYDVSDGGSLSGLTNCGYDDEDRAVMKGRSWESDLNENHLFDSPEPACEFRKFCDERAREHSPFIVCGLYFIEAVDAV